MEFLVLPLRSQRLVVWILFWVGIVALLRPSILLDELQSDASRQDASESFCIWVWLKSVVCVLKTYVQSLNVPESSVS